MQPIHLMTDIPAAERQRPTAAAPPSARHRLCPSAIVTEKHLATELDGDRSLQLWVRDPATQKTLAALGWDGSLQPAAGADFLAVVDSNLGYWIRPGKHSMTKADWEVFVAFADKHFRTGQARGE